MIALIGEFSSLFLFYSSLHLSLFRAHLSPASRMVSEFCFFACVCVCVRSLSSTCISSDHVISTLSEKKKEKNLSNKKAARQELPERQKSGEAV